MRPELLEERDPPPDHVSVNASTSHSDVHFREREFFIDNLLFGRQRAGAEGRAPHPLPLYRLQSGIPHTLDPASYTHTLHPTPNTLHSTPYTLHPTFYTVHHKPNTRLVDSWPVSLISKSIVPAFGVLGWMIGCLIDWWVGWWVGVWVGL